MPTSAAIAKSVKPIRNEHLIESSSEQSTCVMYPFNRPMDLWQTTQASTKNGGWNYPSRPTARAIDAPRRNPNAVKLISVTSNRLAAVPAPVAMCTALRRQQIGRTTSPKKTTSETFQSQPQSHVERLQSSFLPD
jgi:hypothetical protein